MILHMQNYCLLILLLIFFVSMVGSLCRSDFNSTYALLSYIYLSSSKSKVNLGTVLLTLIIITLLVISADLWAIFVQNQVKNAKIAGIITIVLEIILKLLLLVMLVAWKFRGEKTSERDFNQYGRVSQRMIIP